MSALLALACSLLIQSAFADSGSGDGDAQMGKADNLDGFCIEQNKEKPFWKYCQSLTENFQHGEAMTALMEKLRKRVLGKGPKGQESISLPFTCESKPPDPEKSIEKLAEKNPSEFSFICAQYIAMLVTQHSNWDVFKGVDPEDRTAGKGPGGFLGLNLEKGGDQDMDSEKWKDGCQKQVKTTSGNYEGGGQTTTTVKGQSPGPLDGTHNMTCGSYMIFKAIDEDNTSMGHQSDPTKPGGPKKSKGVTRILPDVTDDADESDKKAIAAAKWRQDKMTTFCNWYWKTNSNGKSNSWERQLKNDLGPGDLKDSAPKSDTSQ